MLDRFIEWLTTFWDNLTPYVIVMEYELGVFYRNGHFKKDCPTGGYFKIPFIDKIDIYNSTDITSSLPPQSLITKDKKQVVVRIMIKWCIEDVTLFGNKIFGEYDVISDIGQSSVREIVSARSIDEFASLGVDRAIRDKLKSYLSTYGIKVINVAIIDFTECRSYRLFNESITSPI
jgi:regulator of protease activity HflC (stomatin/prohibitin superfamily)